MLELGGEVVRDRGVDDVASLLGEGSKRCKQVDEKHDEDASSNVDDGGFPAGHGRTGHDLEMDNLDKAVNFLGELFQLHRGLEDKGLWLLRKRHGL